MEDSDDNDRGDPSRNAAVPAPGGGEAARPSDVEAAARHITSMGPAGLSWLARQIRWQGAPPVGGRFQFALSARLPRPRPYLRIVFTLLICTM